MATKQKTVLVVTDIVTGERQLISTSLDDMTGVDSDLYIEAYDYYTRRPQHNNYSEEN